MTFRLKAGTSVLIMPLVVLLVGGACRGRASEVDLGGAVPHLTLLPSGDPMSADTVVEAIDFACPTCRIVDQLVFPMVANDPARRATWAVTPLPLSSLHPNAVTAWVAAWCGNRQGAFAAVAHELFRAQDAWADTPTLVAPRVIRSLTRSLVPDPRTFDACMETLAVADTIRASAARHLQGGIDATPTFWRAGRVQTITTGDDIAALFGVRPRRATAR